MKKRKVVILISGTGSNMSALIEAAKAPDYPAEIIAVISNSPKANGLRRAAKAGIETLTIDHKAFTERDAFDQALDQALNDLGAELICMAGFMRLLGKTFIDRWHNRQINIHPSLLPAFKGLNTHQRAIEAGVKISGCTVHMVRHEMDNGPIIAQAAVPVRPGDDEETLKARIQREEHKLYPKVLAAIASDKIKLSGDLVHFTDTFKEQSGLISPPLGENGTQ